MTSKTINLTGTELAVTYAVDNYPYVWLRNDSTATVYASSKGSVTAGSDGVVSIPMGQSACVYCTGDIVYLLGTGSVMLVASNTPECPFKVSMLTGGSSSVDDVARAAIEAHAADADIHVTATEKAAWNAVNYSNPNLLINPDFRVNQRGQAEYTSGYTVDRWYSPGKCSAAPISGGVKLTSTVTASSTTHAFWQDFEFPLPPGKYTLSLKAADVTGVWAARIRTVTAAGDYVDSYYTLALREGVNKVSVDLPDGEYISAVSIGFNKGTEAGNSLKLAWAKLEGGSLATPFLPPDPATELLKCQRYLFVLPQWSRWRMCEYTSKFLRFEIPTPIKMRIKPTLINSENFMIRSIDIVNELGGFTYEADNYAGNELLIKAIKDSHDITDGVIVASNGNVLLSAEL